MRLPDWSNVNEESSHCLFVNPEGLFLCFDSSKSFSECCIIECESNFIFSSFQFAKTSATAHANFNASSVNSLSSVYRTTGQKAFNLLVLTRLN